jgi:D-cysteine desulfhydrase family pyridoxal phosphate-dependent enzyme
MSSPDRFPLVCLPTPTHPLPRVSSDLGLDVWIKRDDLTGLAMGGNKGRKVEYLIADALARGATTVVTCGSAQSNYIRQLGAACAVAGLRCAAAVMTLPFEGTIGQPSGPRASQGGNVLLNELLGVEVHRREDGPWEELFFAAESLADRLRSAGEIVYETPIGGSSVLGAFAFVRAADELRGLPHFDAVVIPTSSGSTHAGLAYALHGGPTQVIGVACDPEPDLADDLARLVGDLDAFTGLGRDIAADYLDVRFDYVGPGYGVPSEAGRRALTYLARREGILLDPIYSAKAFSGLLDMAERGMLRGRVLFWHTGGAPSLFAYDAEALVGR